MTHDTGINVELLDWVVRQIEDTPEHWDQQNWTNTDKRERATSCRTTFCLAGWAAFLTDHVDGHGVPTAKGRRWANRTSNGWDPYHGGIELNFELLGKQLLGLSGWQAARIFNGAAFDSDEDDQAPRENEVALLRPRIKELLGVDLGPRPDAEVTA